MIRMAAAIVANSGADIFGDGVQILEQIVDRFILKVGVRLEGFVLICDISSMVLVVMDFHGFGVDVRFQCVERIRQRR